MPFLRTVLNTERAPESLQDVIAESEKNAGKLEEAEKRRLRSQWLQHEIKKKTQVPEAILADLAIDMYTQNHIEVDPLYSGSEVFTDILSTMSANGHPEYSLIMRYLVEKDKRKRKITPIAYAQKLYKNGDEILKKDGLIPLLRNRGEVLM